MTSEKLNKLFANYSFKARSINTKSGNAQGASNINTKQVRPHREQEAEEFEEDESRLTIDTTFSNANNQNSGKKSPVPAVPNPTASSKLNY